ncbi:proprotein convertase P-domain-containing protein [Luteolibacter yonseiensis]|uniref:Proprotein convertase P-domain-containing protein n=1 Tax=Luteolibacter yonseiensis TaxID=1144680 RepID=A0A934R862_9BACT|nr:proprotein convertase P-domain-containing protein [Luteolibacter yonseiensis]MBK1817000.1 proprotein convertase P-domain-containing protein [Luteolibacter yonseiensis]
MKPLLLIALFVPLCTAARAAVTFTTTLNATTTIPDNDDTGTVSHMTITPDTGDVPSARQIEIITNVSVGLNFSDGWNGDLFVYLVHDSGFAILLNRIGREEGNPDGNGTSGMAVTLDDSASGNIHQPLSNSGILTGTHQPDGRNTDPDSVLASDPRTALLSSFNGLNAAGQWTLFVADLNPGDQSTLQSWTLTITAVPEPCSAALLLGACLLAVRRGRPAPHVGSEGRLG